MLILFCKSSDFICAMYLEFFSYSKEFHVKELLFPISDIFVAADKVFKEPGESAMFNCSAAIGNITNFRKTVNWYRVDQSQLPEGAFSHTAAFPDEKGYLTATLSFPQIATWHAGEYGCFVDPPVEHFNHKPARPAKFVLTVNGNLSSFLVIGMWLATTLPE